MPLESLDAVYSPRLLGLKRKFRCDEGRNPYLMQVKRIGLVGTIRALTIGLLLITVTQLAAQDDCERVITALTKVITTQSHIYSTTTTAPMGGAPKDQPRMTVARYVPNTETSNRRSDVLTLQIVRGTLLSCLGGRVQGGPEGT